MKKLYFLDEEEKNRILNLHESATKRQYLSEQIPFGPQIPPNPYKTALDNMKGNANWEGKYSCVPSQGVKPTKLKDGSTMYIINGVKYYSNGRKKMADGKMSNYACETEFIKEGERQANITKVYCSVKNGMITTGSLKNSPWNDYVKSFKITSQEIETAKKSCSKTNKTKQSSGNRQQIISQTENNTKAIQKLLKLPETGIMDTTLLQKINEVLNGGGTSASTQAAASTPAYNFNIDPNIGKDGINFNQMTPEQLVQGVQSATQPKLPTRDESIAKAKADLKAARGMK